SLLKISWSYNPNIAETTLVWANPSSLATTIGITFVFFSSAYLDVSVQQVRLPFGMLCLQHNGLPHSDICGSPRVCQSPQLFAAYHVLLRLCEPRHPPYALSLLFVLYNLVLCQRSYVESPRTFVFLTFVFRLNLCFIFFFLLLAFSFQSLAFSFNNLKLKTYN